MQIAVSAWMTPMDKRCPSNMTSVSYASRDTATSTMFSWKQDMPSPQHASSRRLCAALATTSVSRPWSRLNSLASRSPSRRKCCRGLLCRQGMHKPFLWNFSGWTVLQSVWSWHHHAVVLCHLQITRNWRSVCHRRCRYGHVRADTCHLIRDPWHPMYQKEERTAFVQKYVLRSECGQMPDSIPCHDWLRLTVVLIVTANCKSLREWRRMLRPTVSCWSVETVFS